jgi:hypothetical protein
LSEGDEVFLLRMNDVVLGACRTLARARTEAESVMTSYGGLWEQVAVDHWACDRVPSLLIERHRVHG